MFLCVGESKANFHIGGQYSILFYLIIWAALITPMFCTIESKVFSTLREVWSPLGSTDSTEDFLWLRGHLYYLLLCRLLGHRQHRAGQGDIELSRRPALSWDAILDTEEKVGDRRSYTTDSCFLRTTRCLQSITPTAVKLCNNTYYSFTISISP